MFYTSTVTQDVFGRKGSERERERGREKEGGREGGEERGRGQACTCKERVIVWQSHSLHTNGGQCFFFGIIIIYSHTSSPNTSLPHVPIHLNTSTLHPTPLHRHWLTARAHLPPSWSARRGAEGSPEPGSPRAGRWSPRVAWSLRRRSEDCLWPQNRTRPTHSTGMTLCILLYACTLLPPSRVFLNIIIIIIIILLLFKFHRLWGIIAAIFPFLLYSNN